MSHLTLTDLSSNAYRILGLTVDASQNQIDAAARKMRIFQDPSMIPATANDAPFLGPVPRSPQDIESAVARLADPTSRVQERLWWFCQTPPDSDAIAPPDSANFRANHDAALIYLYRGLLTGADDQTQTIWQDAIGRFTSLSTSDDYLQWLFEIESTGDFDKRATLEEIASAQQTLPQRLSTAVARSVSDALAAGDFTTAANAINLVRAGAPHPTAPDGSDALLDRMEDDLAGRCNELVNKINTAWKTRQVTAIRPACNHAISRFGTIIQPLIDQILAATNDIDRQHRAASHGINLLIHTSQAYSAFENFLACQRTLETALALATNTPMEPSVSYLLDKVKEAARRQRAGAPRGHRQLPPGKPEFKLKPGGPIKHESWLRSIPLYWLAVPLLFAVGITRMACNSTPAPATPQDSVPHYDSAHPPPWETPAKP